VLEISAALFDATYNVLRQCGGKERECQVLWLSAPPAPNTIVAIRHSKHFSDEYGLEVDSAWLTSLWIELARTGQSVRAQVHTHGGKPFHSKTDDDFPIVGTPGFVSIVIPYFARVHPDVERLYVTAIAPQGGWIELQPLEAILVT
jgi:hypothetical protein